MGTLYYGNDEAGISIDDETLAHLAAVTVAKLRRHEPFLLTCASDAGRDAVWMHTAATVRFAYASEEQVPLDKARLEAMVRDTNRSTGLTVASTAVLSRAAVGVAA